MKNTNTGISRFFVPALMVGVMAVTLPATVAFAQRVFPGNLIRQITLVGLTEAAFIAWHAATLFAARGDKQHAVAQAMTWVSLFGAAGALVVLSIDRKLTERVAGLEQWQSELMKKLEAKK
jgi:hypothetical protein